MRQVYGTLIGRWYVTVLGVTYVVLMLRHFGWRRTLAYTALALAVGGLFENLSVHVGVPYTKYVFNPSLRRTEVFLGDVPLAVPLSYTFMGYFAFAAGRMVASGPWRTRARRWWHEYLLGVVLMVWAVWIFDPVARLGRRWFLGRLFHYQGSGFWFGLPTASQAGFALTAAILVGALVRLGRHDVDRPVARLREHPGFAALLTYHAQLLWLASVAFYLGADTLGGSLALMWIPAAAVTAVYWSATRPGAVDGVGTAAGAERVARFPDGEHLRVRAASAPREAGR